MKRIVVATLAILCLALLFPRSSFSQWQREEDLSAQDLLIRSQVQTAISMLETISVKQQHGELTLEQAKQLGADLLRGLHFGRDGYFWADTTDGVNVVLYGSDVEGKNRLEAKDIKGKPFIKDFIATAKAGGGFVNYWFPKRGRTTPLAKRSYVELFEPFGWVVGTGYYTGTK